MCKLTKSFYAPQILTENGWQDARVVQVNAAGTITRISNGSEKQCDYSFKGAVIPGMVNLHSHAFQRSLLGQTGLRGQGKDSFWSWREAMYSRVEKLTPEDIEAITAFCYMELLRSGYTSVAEFHYLHHQPNGGHYQNLAETSLRVLKSAETTGIGLTLLPVLYTWSGFGEQPLAPRQMPFKHDLESYFDLITLLDKECEASNLTDWGVAPHSLRAVSHSQLLDLADGLKQQDFSGPIHIHIAEQQQEVDASLDHYGNRPIQWLLDSVPVDEKWCLVHATHATTNELVKMRQAGVVIGLCPSTEADLGDGVFPATEWKKLGGCWGIGSDSNLCVNPAEELRLLEFGQRLRDQQRNLMADPGSIVGADLYKNALSGGLQALAKPPAKGFAVGQRADFLVFNQQHPMLLGKQGDQLLDTWVFGGCSEMLLQVWVAGQCQIENGQHKDMDNILSAWNRYISRLQ